MAPRLSAVVKAEIEHALEQTANNPDFAGLAEAYNTTIRTIRQIRRKLRDKKVFGTTIGSSKLGPKVVITPEMEETALILLDMEPWLFQDELAECLYDIYGVKVSQSMVSRMLKQVSMTRKRLKVEAAQRNPELRAAWQWNIRELQANQFVFVDESGSDERTGDRNYGYALSGSRAIVKRWLQGRKRVSVLPAYTLDGYIESITFLGTCTGDIFEDFIVDTVLPHMNQYPAEKSILVMDNASIHHSNIQAIQGACDVKGVRLIFLPPYSPDYNPIEESFSVLKAFIRRHYHKKKAQFADYQAFLEWAVVTCGTGAHAAKNARAHFRNANIHGVLDETA
jgi:transposase